MEFPDLDLPNTVLRLLPGFVSAWIFFWLTAHPTRSPFERTIQALILTAVIKALSILLKATCLMIGRMGFLYGIWNHETEYACSIGMAVSLGWGMAFASNKNILKFELIRKLTGTSKTTYPSVWYGSFKERNRYIYLHLTGNRRIYGWPRQWPAAPDSGHFELVKAAWLLSDNTLIQLVQTESILIPVKDVEMVEFEKLADESPLPQDVEQIYQAGVAAAVQATKDLRQRISLEED